MSLNTSICDLSRVVIFMLCILAKLCFMYVHACENKQRLKIYEEYTETERI